MFLKYFITALILCFVKGQSVVTDVKLDTKELRCLVCKTSIRELTEEVQKTDNSQFVNIGGHRLDPEGNYNAPKSIPLAQSEIYLSEVIENICQKMDDYVRGLWKSNGTLTIIKMVSDNGQMNPFMNEVDFVQDDDLNKSLKYYCESIMEEYEEQIIQYYQNEIVENIDHKICTEELNLCPLKRSTIEKEL